MSLKQTYNNAPAPVHLSHDAIPRTKAEELEMAMAVMDDPGLSGVEKAQLILDIPRRREQMLLDKIRALETELYTDQVTAGHNRKAFMKHAEEAVADIQSNPSQAYDIVFIDLDGFKAVNDQCGHEAGDMALLETDIILHDIIREGDIAARLGGDEMVLLLKHEEGRDLTHDHVADVIRKNLRGHCQWDAAMNPHVIGASIGAGTLTSNSVANLSAEQAVVEVLKIADEAMYIDKEGKQDRLDAEREAIIQAWEAEHGRPFRERMNDNYVEPRCEILEPAA